MKKKFSLIIIAAFVLLFSACSSKEQVVDGEDKVPGFIQISQDEAKQMMEMDDGHIVVDVRRPDEYASGHIPGAICIPNESIAAEQPKELQDLDQVILIYCRSGNRSKQAAKKLFDMGYTNVYEFGGIIEWTGEVVTGTQADSTSASQSESQTEVESDSTSASQSESQTEVESEAQSDSTSASQIESPAEAESQAENMEDHTMKLTIGDVEVPVIWEKNDSVNALAELVKESPLTIQMSMYGGFEQVGPIGQSIVRDDKQTTTEAGDIVLYSGNQVVIFYGSNAWAYTRLGHVDLPQNELEELLGNGDVVLTIG